LSSLRAGLAVVAVLATAALGVAVWTLLDGDDARDGASPVRVERLEDRLDEVESDVEDAASQTGAAEIRETQRDLQSRLQALEEASGDSAAMREAVEEVAQSVETLQESVDELEARLDILEQPE
jgi:chromosome segregation ATPase